MINKLISIVSFLCCFALANTVFATEVPGGNVSGVWTTDGNPYLVQGHLLVDAGESLVIEPGVEVLFEGNYQIRIKGNFEANGAPGDSILFSTNTGFNSWGGFLIDSLDIASDTVRFSHTKLTQLNSGRIRVFRTGKFIFEDSRVFDNSGHWAGLFYVYDSDIQVRNCIFENNATTSQSDGGVFYLTDGAPLIENNTFKGNSATYSGGAIAVWRQNGPSTPIIRNNYFQENYAGSGGALVIRSNCVPIIENNTFYNNNAYYDGGAIWQGYVQAGTIQYSNNQFLENHAVDLGGAVRTIECKVDFIGDVFDGNSTDNSAAGALHFEDEGTVATITNCRFSNNTGSQGGAVHALDNCIVNFESCLFNNNTATSFGGALVLTNYITSTFSNCIFVNNSSTNLGGVMRLIQFSNPVFINCTFANNSAEGEASVVSLYWDSDPYFYNCIAYGNTSDNGTSLTVQDYIWHTCEPTISNCLWEGGEEGISLGTSAFALWENNYDEDPLFVYPSEGAGTAFDGQNAIWEFLADDSPCIDAGITEGLSIPEFDYNGEIRVQGGLIDLGAFEGGTVVSSPGVVQDAVGGNFCSDAPLEITFVAAGSEPMSFQWFYNSTPLTDQTETNLFMPAGTYEAGSYRCLASNVAGEMYSSWAQVSISSPIEISPEIVTEITCDGDLAEVQLTIEGGEAPYAILFDGIAIFGNEVVDVLEGEHEVEVTDADGCSITQVVSILPAIPLELNITEVVHATCDACEDGSIVLSMSNENGETLSVNGESYTQETISGLAIGEYLLELCNEQGCCTQTTVAVEEDGFPQEIDFDNNGEITSDDFLTFIGNFGCVGLDCVGDLNGDGLVNVTDLILFLGLF